jgi:hypothetical protein
VFDCRSFWEVLTCVSKIPLYEMAKIRVTLALLKSAYSSRYLNKVQNSLADQAVAMTRSVVNTFPEKDSIPRRAGIQTTLFPSPSVGDGWEAETMSATYAGIMSVSCLRLWVSEIFLDDQGIRLREPWV